MKHHNLYPRYLHNRVVEALTDTPMVLIHEPRQCGKTTLAQLAGEEENFIYYTFDNDIHSMQRHKLILLVI